MTRAATTTVQGGFAFGARRRPCAPRFVDQQLEAALLADCLDLLARRGIPAWRANTGVARFQNATGGAPRFVRFGPRGQSDILGLIPPNGRLLAVETKAAGRKPTSDQVEFLDAINRAGGLALCVYSVAELNAALDAARLGARQPLAEISESVGPVKSRNEDGSPSISELPARGRGRSWRSTRSADSLVPANDSNLETTTRKTRRPATC